MTIELKRSPIHGKGLFTTIPLNADTCVGEYSGQIIKTDPKEERETDAKCCLKEHTVDFALNSHEFVRGDGILNFVNHSKKPNLTARTYARKIRFYTKRKIKAGEELTLNYNCDCGEC